MTYEDSRNQILKEYFEQTIPFNKKFVDRLTSKAIKIGLIVPKTEDPIYGVGRGVAIAERDFIKDLIISDKRIKPVDVSGEVSLFSILNHTECDNGVILLPSHYYTELLTTSAKFISFKTKSLGGIMNGFKLVPFPQSKLDKLIIIEQDDAYFEGVSWEVLKEDNGSLIIKENKGQWEVFTLNKIDLDPKYIKILDFKNKK